LMPSKRGDALLPLCLHVARSMRQQPPCRRQQQAFRHQKKTTTTVGVYEWRVVPAAANAARFGGQERRGEGVRRFQVDSGLAGRRPPRSTAAPLLGTPMRRNAAVTRVYSVRRDHSQSSRRVVRYQILRAHIIREPWYACALAIPSHDENLDKESVVITATATSFDHRVVDGAVGERSG
jgi:hypothetical protein